MMTSRTTNGETGNELRVRSKKGLRSFTHNLQFKKQWLIWTGQRNLIQSVLFGQRTGENSTPCEPWSPCSAWPYLLSTSMIIELLANWPDMFIRGRHCSWASSRRLASVGWNSVLPSKIVRHNCQNRLAKLFAIANFGSKPIHVSRQSLRLLPAIHLH